MNKWIKGTNSTVLGVALVALFIFVTLIVGNFEGFETDLTANKRFSLSDQTKKMVEQVTEPIKVITFITTENQQAPYIRQVTDLLNEYHRANELITIETVDPVKNPALARKYAIDSDMTVVFERGERQKQISAVDLFLQGQDSGSYLFNGEEAFTRALLFISGQLQQKAYYVTGHGEATPEDAGVFYSKVENQGLKLEELNVSRVERVPSDAAVVMMIGPIQDLAIEDAAKLAVYVQNQGKMLVALNIPQNGAKLANLDGLLAQMGVVNQNAVVVEPAQSVGNQGFKLVPFLSTHPISKPIVTNGLAVTTAFAISLQEGISPWKWVADPLMKTSDQAYAKTDLKKFITNFTKEDISQTASDLSGEQTLAFALRDDQNRAKAVVFGSTLMFGDEMFQEQSNRDLLLNSVSWLQGEANMLTIRPKEERLQQVTVLPAQQQMIFLGTVVIFPLILLMIGGVIWWRRSRG